MSDNQYQAGYITGMLAAANQLETVHHMVDAVVVRERIRAAAEKAVPEGYVLVPLAAPSLPTVNIQNAMATALQVAYYDHQVTALAWESWAIRAFRAMLAAVKP